MKNLTTLSIITATIIGLTGCGGDSSSPKTADETVSSITKLANASQKHSDTDWEVLTGQIIALDNTKDFNTMLLGSIEKNIATLNTVGIDKEEAYAINSDAMFDDLTELDIPDLDNQVVAECKEDDTCKEEAYASLNTTLDIDKEEAYAMAEELRENDKEEAYAIVVNDGLVKEFACEVGEVKTVQHYGFEDVFSTANGVEVSSQNPSDIGQSMIDYNNNVNAGFANYDETHNDRQFLEDINNLPAGITKGRFYIGLKSNGSSLQVNDTLSIGDLSGTNDRYAKALTGLQGDGWQENLVNNSNPTTAIYSNDFSNIPLNMQTGNTSDTLLTVVNSNQRFGAYVQDDTSVDFITVATCSAKDSIKELTAIVNKFECNEKQGDIFKITGGVIDNFALDFDTTTASSSLETEALSNTVYSTLAPYDYDKYDYHFVDTLNMNLSSSQTVTKAELNIGYKAIGSPLYSNDKMYLGDIQSTASVYKDIHLYNTPLANNINGYGKLIKVDLDTLTNNSTGTVFDTLLAQNALDVYVQDDTAVDYTQLNLCVKDNCDEEAETHSIDLSQLASWTTSATDAIENNPIPNVWDDSMNWIEFTSKETNGNRVLEIPFCACSNTIVNLKSLKADNSATVKLDSNVIATQNASGQAAMLANNNGGVQAGGTLTVPAGTNGVTNHVLRVDVTNQSSYFGVALEGTLDFKGNLGKCK